MNGVEDILIKLGYDLHNEGSAFWRALPIYRESSNTTSLRIAKENGSFIDFSANIKGSLEGLVKITLGLSSIKEAKEWMQSEGSSFEKIEKKAKIFVDKKIELKYTQNLMPHYSFYKSRGISEETLNKFECGVCFSGKQNNRFVFVIRDEFDEVKGVAGRDIIGGRVKWKLMGDKRKWIFPLFSVKTAEERKEIFLVESIGDMLSLYEIGVNNVIVLFGIDISGRLINLLSTLNLKRIFISVNNDTSKEKNWGSLAAEGIKNKLSKIIDEDIIKIALPPSGDWNEMEEQKRIEYVKEIRNS